MIISRFRLNNWRNFKHVDVPMQERVFLVGPNASGKSNFIDAIRFLRDIAKTEGGGLQKAVKDRGGISKIRCLAARKHPEIEIETELSQGNGSKASWVYSIGIRQDPRGYRQPYIVHEKVWKDGSLILERPDSDDKKDKMRLTQTHLEQISANEPYREVARFFSSISYTHLVPQLLRHPGMFKGFIGNEDPFGRTFLDRISETTSKTRIFRLGKIEKALKTAVPQLKKLSLSKDKKGIPHLEAVYEHWRAQGAKQNEEEFSDGTLRLIGLLWCLLEGDSLLMLEEPELSLHPGIISKLPAILWRVQAKKKRQVIVSTHSPDLLSDHGISAEEVLMLTPIEEGTKIELASSKKEIKSLLENGLSIGEIIIPKTEPEQIQQLLLNFQ